MDAGRIVLDDTPSNIFQSDKVSDFGLELPPIIALAKKFKDSGILQGYLALSKDELLEDLCQLISKT